MTIDLSVVIPVRNESPNLRPLHDELTDALTRWGGSYELLFVDDGSTDDSFEILATLARVDPHVHVIRFRRNFGQTAAFSAGFAHARGRVIVTADGDRQNDPHDIPRLVERLAGGYDIVCGWRKDRKDKLLTRRVPSIIANHLISRATGVELHDYGCSLKAFRAEVVKPLRLYGEMHRFIPAIASEMGVRITEEVVNHRPRTHGVSKYGLSRTIRVVLDLLTVKFLLSYSTRPLQMFGVIGLILGGFGSLVTGWLVVQRLFFEQAIADRPLLLMGILLIFTGVQFVTLGLLAELQTRTYHESQNKPTYVIRDIVEREPVLREVSTGESAVRSPFETHDTTRALHATK
jgi:glycosyltransferase involved in cell wall biosynthesis